jgi:hypothetical protein
MNGLLQEKKEKSNLLKVFNNVPAKSTRGVVKMTPSVYFTTTAFPYSKEGCCRFN